jgi:hypothetical protein
MYSYPVLLQKIQSGSLQTYKSLSGVRVQTNVAEVCFLVTPKTMFATRKRLYSKRDVKRKAHGVGRSAMQVIES